MLRLRLPCAFLAEHSKDLRARIETSLSIPAHLRDPIRLSTADPRAFEIYLQWLYHGNLHMHIESSHGKQLVRIPELDDALAAWELGQDLLDATFQDACTDHVLALAMEFDPAPWGYVRRIYGVTNHGSGLRRLFRAMMCEEKLPLQWRRDETLGSQMLGQAAYEEYKVERRENGKTWDKRKAGKVEGTWRDGGCRFHDHGGDECGATKHLRTLEGRK